MNENNGSNNSNSHICEQIPAIVALQKDVEGVEKRVVVIESKQDKLSESVLEIREFRSVQMETNKFLSKVVEQNSELMAKIDDKYSKLEEKYDKDISENTEKIHNLEIAMITGNNSQDKDYGKDKVNVILKVASITFGIVMTLLGIIWKFLVP